MSGRLHSAVEAGDTDAVARLCRIGAPVDEHEDFLGWTPLIRAAHQGHKGVVARLLEADAKIEATDVYGGTALIKAAERGHKEVVGQLLEAGADTTATTKNGWAARDCGKQHGHAEVVALLPLGTSKEIFQAAMKADPSAKEPPALIPLSMSRIGK